jgi:hypothetical protein
VSIGGNRPAVFVCVCALASATLVAGCALFSPQDVATTIEAHRQLLPRLRPAPEAIQLQVVFIDRPADDPTLTQLLWQEVDEVGAVPPAVRSSLNENGLRVAQCGATVPPTLQTLLGLAGDQAPFPAADGSTFNGRQLSLMSGQEGEFVINDPLEACSVNIRINGQSDRMEFEHASCALKIRPVRLQDGWVRLEFAPEIRHGDSRMRHMPTDEGWALRGGQKVDARHALKFQVTLNSGEMAIVGAASGSDTLGGQFLRRENEGQAQQRLFVIRVADVGRSDTALDGQP